jgi:uncharacterized protein YegP (UPF0339 family)
MKFVIFKDEIGEWRWRLVGRNGRIIAAAGESFKRKGGCKKSVEKVREGALMAPITEEGESTADDSYKLKGD